MILFKCNIAIDFNSSYFNSNTITYLSDDGGGRYTVALAVAFYYILHEGAL